MKKRILFLSIILGITLVVGACGEEAADSDSGATEGSEEAEETAATDNAEADNTDEVEPEEYKIGDTVTHNNYELIVEGVEKSEGNEFEKPKDGHEFVIVKVTINNNGEEDISYNPFDFKLKNSQGQITEQGLITVDSDTSLSSGELAPGGSVTGTIPFEAPKDDPDLRLIFEPDFWTGEQVEVILSEK